MHCRLNSILLILSFILLQGCRMFLGLRVWEIVDLWYTPIYMDRRLEELNSKSRLPKVGITPNGSGANLLLSWDL